MPVLPEGGDLLSFVPRINKGVARVIKVNAVVADTLIASQEMARERDASIEQDFDFERILVVTAGFTAGVSEI